MKRLACTLLLLSALVQTVMGQAQKRKLPSTINHPAYNNFAPYISFDANALIFVSDNAEDNALIPFYTYRDGTSDWKEPQPLPKTVYTRFNYLWGHTVSVDGKKLYYSTMKMPSAGGFDIWASDWKTNTWAEGTNIAPPINSKLHEASPSLTIDGNTMYFMRCEKMDQKSADVCKIFSITKKSNGDWGTPVELPATINTGNSQHPRIMADGATLIFSSNKIPGNKGGMDLYLSRLENGSWSKPIPLDFVNTDKDDQHVTVTALGRYLTRDEKGRSKNELVEYLFPSDQRPKGMMKIEGKVTDPNGAPVASYVTVVDLKSNKRVLTTRPGADGSFLAYLMEGTEYEFAVDPEKDNLNFFTKKYDLMAGDKIPQIEKLAVTLKVISPGDEISLDRVSFQPYSDEINQGESSSELKRLVRLAKANPDLKFEIQALLRGYEEDSVQSSPDLTEVFYDTLVETIDDIDTLGQLYQRDSITIMPTWHNDRTIKQAQSIIRYLVSQGVSENNLSFFVNAVEAVIPEEKKLTIKAVARKK